MEIEQAAREGWLSVGQAAHKLGLSVARVRQLIDSGVLTAERTVLGWLLDPSSVAALQAQREGRNAD